ncbi:hypothetical protein [Pseudomonas sp. QTF5]|uniref:hypothetical protein n=1 Tax=Pseudomonas sp. QTF5 TaxID=1435425 RepID=UPI0004BE3A9A|nr:hypothetical protein [Pseudomonas sp. QTF5]
MTQPAHCSFPFIIDETLSRELAIIERADNDGRIESSRPKRAVAKNTKFWANGRTLRIAITRYNEDMYQTVVSAINQWAPHVNLTFEFLELPDNDEEYEGDIRIYLASHYDGEGGSAIGTDALAVASHIPTMFLGTKYQTPYFTQAALHEFGHALGLEHEHQHPDATLQWNMLELYREFKRLGWSKELVDSNVLKKLEREEVRFSTYDQNSIMHYSFPGSVMLDGVAIASNSVISVKDIEFISSVYPR